MCPPAAGGVRGGRARKKTPAILRAQRAVFLAVFLAVFFAAAFFTVFLAAAFLAGAAFAAAVFLAGAFLAVFLAVVRTARFTGFGATSSLVKGARAWSSSLANVAWS